MVDINLLGEEKRGVPGAEGEEAFAEAASMDVKELVSDKPVPSRESVEDFTRKVPVEKRKAPSGSLLVILIAAVLFAVALYFLIKQRAFGPAKPTVAEKEVVTPTTPPEVSARKPAVVEPVLPAFAKEMVASTQESVNAVNTVVSSAPADIALGTVSYTGHSLMIESLASSSGALDQLGQTLKEKFPQSEIRMVSRDQKTVGGQTTQRAIFSGTLPEGVPPVQKGEITYLAKSDAENRMKKDCQELGLVLKSFEVTPEVKEAQYVRTPILLKAVGDKEAALKLLQKISEANLNLAVNKILLVFSDRKALRDKTVNLFLWMELCQPL